MNQNRNIAIIIIAAVAVAGILCAIFSQPNAGITMGG